MESCFKLLQLKYDQKLTNLCIGLTLKISVSTVFESLARFKATSCRGSSPQGYLTTPLKNSFSRLMPHPFQN